MARLSTGRAATELGVDRSTVRRWAEEGKIPAMRTPGGRFLIDQADVAKALKPVAARRKDGGG